MAFGEELNALVQRTKANDENPSRTASYKTINRTLNENKKRHEVCTDPQKLDLKI